ncbi:type I restriction endonuclease subunit R [Agromyces sp. ISL-38]|uniref:type I restriction endonuclease subunit R n=1 Tax=Agromyces sp. ISL-38 TaxID=2819107 RepID=UPI001BEB300C|nr:HsdR family type I site-specific deoxyribonuclease [Agromyces sp. ISL-38]MBT2497571.1 type I restriction endonuclease subunit R [Agromyces sp. ISL-38]
MTDGPIDPSERYQSQVPALQLLAGLGYRPLAASEALALRGGRRRNAVLEDVLAEQLVRLNTIEFRGKEYPLDPADAREVIRKLLPEPEQQRGLQATSLDVFNKLVGGATLAKAIDGDTKSHSVRYIDWAVPANNVFHVTAEYRVERTGSSATRRCDIVAFVNGIPFIVIENKRPSDEVKKADSQLIKYQGAGEIPQLFHFAQLLISTNRRDARYATIGTPRRYWHAWREEDDDDASVIDAANHPLDHATRDALFSGEFAGARAYFDELAGAGPRAVSEQDRMLHALCRPERLLELVRTFTVFDEGKRKIARHQQFFAVKRALERVTSGAAGEERPGGVVWHTQGSGKSLTMVMLGKALEFEASITNPRLILVTDRDDLDVQIRDTFRACKQDPKRARSGKHLAELIAERAGLITTIVNKFENAVKQGDIRDDDPDVFVLVDESHRSHSASVGEYGAFAKAMRRMLPRANYIGFTGTPLLKREKSTFRTFGGLIHRYTIADAVDDEAVLPLLYEGRMVEQQIAENVIDTWFDKISQGLTVEQQRDLKRKFSRADALAGAGQVVRAKAYDISEHYRQNWQGTGLKAQLVAPNKAAAIRFKQELDEIGHVTSEVMISAPGDDEGREAVDRDSRDLVQRFWEAAMQRWGSEAEYNKQIIAGFKGVGHPEILIVVSKLLTGFDAPRNTVLYLCRNLREHTLLQAIARVNRLFDDGDETDRKEFGYVIDYEGLLGELDAALTTYSALDGFDDDELIGAVIDIREQIRLLPSRWSAVWDLFKGVPRDMEALEQFLIDEPVRHEFYERLADFSRTLHIALSSDKVDDIVPRERLVRYRSDWKFFSNLRRSAQLRYQERVDLRDYEPKIQKLLDDHLSALPAEVIIDPLNLNDPAALKAVVEETGVTAASRADRIATATRHRITERMDQDPALYARFSELLQQTIDEFRAHRMSELEYLKHIVSIAEGVAGRERRREVPAAVAHDEHAASVFEAILARFVHAANGDALPDDQVAEVARTLVDLVRPHLIVGIWQNDQAQNELLNTIDDYLWDELEGRRGLSLTPDDEDVIRGEVIRITKARHR